MRVLKKILLGVVALIGLVVGAVGLLFLTLWIEHNTALELPEPSGSFAVGRVQQFKVDSMRLDPFAPSDSVRKRELVVWMWYPAHRVPNTTFAPYLPNAWSAALAAKAGPVVTQFFFRNPSNVQGHSVENAPIADDSAAYPVILFNSGIGALALQYSSIIEDLASHGYIVVASDKPYSTSVVVLPDGRVIHNTAQGNPGDGRVPDNVLDQTLAKVMEVWTQDSQFLLGELEQMNIRDSSGMFTGKMRLESVGIAGHSIGGATAAQFCLIDERCRAGVDIDGRLYGRAPVEGIGKPFLFLLADYPNAWTAAQCDICSQIRGAAQNSPHDKLIVTMEGAQHFSFGDQSLTQSRILRRILLTISGQGRLDARLGLLNARQYLHEFFDVHLRGSSREKLYDKPLMPGVRFESLH